MYGLALTWRNVSGRRTCSKFSAIPCFLWDTRNQSTELEEVKFTGTKPWILLCPNLALAAGNIFDAPLIAEHNTVANAKFSAFLRASAYTEHLKHWQLWK